jgi:hypothetical protein
MKVVHYSLTGSKGTAADRQCRGFPMHGITERHIFIPLRFNPYRNPGMWGMGANGMNVVLNKAGDMKMALKQEGASNILALYGTKAFEYLVTSLWDPDKWVRIAAADALAGLEDIRAYRYMVALLGDKDPDVRFAVSVSLGKLGDARAIRPLESACHDRNYFVRQGAGESLKRLNEITAARGWQRLKNNTAPSIQGQINPEI